VPHHTKPYSKPSNASKLASAQEYARKWQASISNTKYLTDDEKNQAKRTIAAMLNINKHSSHIGLAMTAWGGLRNLVDSMESRRAVGWSSQAMPKKADVLPAPIVDKAQPESTVKQIIITPAEPLNYREDITVAILNEKATALLNAISCITLSSEHSDPLQALILQKKKDTVSNAKDALLQIIDADRPGTCLASTGPLKQFMQIEADVLNLLWVSGIKYVASDYAMAKIARAICLQIAKGLESAYPEVNDEDKAWITQNKQLFENGPNHFNIDEFLHLQAIIRRGQENAGHAGLKNLEFHN